MPMRALPRPRLGLAPGSASTTTNASIRALVTARRGKSIRKAYGYVDDRLRRPAALPPLPEQAPKGGKVPPSPTGCASPASRASSEGGEMLAFAHIPTGATANEGFNIDEVNNRFAEPAVALTATGADIETGRVTP